MDEIFSFGSKQQAEYGNPITLLHKHFGLDVHVAKTAKADGKLAKWPESPKRIYPKINRPPETTICYLTLPRTPVAPQVSTGGNDDNEPQQTTSASQTLSIEPSGSGTRARVARRFHRALVDLHLQPYLHPSQGSDTISADAEQDVTEGGWVPGISPTMLH